MKPKIIATGFTQLLNLIKEEVNKNGWECDLNHIDVSNMVDLSHLFSYSRFNGDISKWDVSNVKFMNKLFFNSNFNGDISNWNVQNVKNMHAMFEKSQFNGDLSDWKPYEVMELENIFLDCPVNSPYWAEHEDKRKRNIAIDNYWMKKNLNKELKEELSPNSIQNKKVKL